MKFITVYPRSSVAGLKSTLTFTIYMLRSIRCIAHIQSGVYNSMQAAYTSHAVPGFTRFIHESLTPMLPRSHPLVRGLTRIAPLPTVLQYHSFTLNYLRWVKGILSQPVVLKFNITRVNYTCVCLTAVSEVLTKTEVTSRFTLSCLAPVLRTLVVVKMIV